MMQCGTIGNRFWFACLAAVALMVAAGPAFAACVDSEPLPTRYTQTVGDYRWTYVIDGTHSCIVGIEPDPADEPVKVTCCTIGSNLDGSGILANCLSLQSVTFARGVTEIGDDLCGCRNIRDIVLPASVCSIANGAFESTDWWENQPDGLVRLGDWIVGYKGERPSDMTFPSDVVGVVAESFSGNDVSSLTLSALTQGSYQEYVPPKLAASKIYVPIVQGGK